ncbi:hypothetical protein F5Y14DRAFT_406649 [Nemania sp. NC0429]|nr:hypothetical protein F5Y14DRAFT_406649 [Nemania sp. NC0429]
MRMSDPTQKLIDELCSRLDEATILSIAGDFDLQNQQEFAAARDVLLAISMDVEAEEATGFNPSGFGDHSLAGDLLSDSSASSKAVRAAEGDLKSSDEFTTATGDSGSHPQSTVSDASSKASPLTETPGIVHVNILDDLTDEEKEKHLAAMFVCLKLIDVKMALQKSNGDADLAIDGLLNLQLLEQTGQRPKGVDGFYVSDDDVPRGKKKARKRAKKASKAVNASQIINSKSTYMVPAQEGPDQDDNVNHDNVKFISDHFSLPTSEATEIYRSRQSSLGNSIIAILDNYIALGWRCNPSQSQLQHMKEQEERVPWIPSDYFSPIFNTTATPEAAVDVVDVLANHFKKPAYLKHKVPYSVIASDLELDSDMSLSSTRAQASRGARPLPTTLQEASATKATLAASTKHSFAVASSAFRKGKADPLMRQAASFFADRARTEAISHRAAISMEAELLVDQQSTEDTIDLHGVTVNDGVDIALRRVWRWWDARGQAEKTRGRAGKAVDDGLKVVTGIGRHNPDGKSRLRINVFKALVEDGWKVEALNGSFLVTGRRR